MARRTWAAALVLAWAAGRTMAAGEATVGATGEKPLPEGGRVVATLTAGLPAGADGLTWTPVDGDAGRPAVRGTITKTPANAWTTQLALVTTEAVQEHDVLLAVLRVRGRARQSPEAAAQFNFEDKGPDNRKSHTQDFTVGEQWTTLYFPFEAAVTTGPGEAQATVRLGYAEQSVDFESVTVLNYGRSTKASDLPATRFTYTGREPDAPWRAAADARIDQLRKGDLAVSVYDAGKPVADARVVVEMKRHAFLFGTCVSPQSLLTDKSAGGDTYRRELLRLFNTAVPDNPLKWGGFEADPKRATAMVDWCAEHGLTVRGHNLVWPSWQYTPKRIKEGYEQRKADPAVAAEWLRTETANHVTAEAKHFAGRLAEWDVINEQYSEHDLLDVLGRGVMADWLKRAHAADPKARLFMNDYGLESGDARDRRKQDATFDAIKAVIDAGAPLGGIGFQGHFGWVATSPDRLLALFDRFAAFGLPIVMTEFDMPVRDEQLQADYTRDLMTVLFSHRSVSGFVMWGFWAGNHWRPEGAMFRKDWSPKPNLKAYEDLVLSKWWTRADGRTDSSGRYGVRGFCGEYDLTVSAAGRQTTRRVTLGREGAAVRIDLSESQKQRTP